MTEWVTAPLGEIANIAIGGTPARDNQRYWDPTGQEGYPWVSIADLGARFITSTKEQITDDGVRFSNVKPVAKDTLLLSFKLTIGRAGIAGCDLFTNEAIAAIKPFPGTVAPKFLYYVLPSVAKNAVTDTAIKGVTLNKQKLASLVVRFPKNIEIQKSLADIIETVDVAIEKTDALIDKYNQIRAGLIYDLFTRGVAADGKLRLPREQAPELYQATAIGWIPKEWDCRKLGKILNESGGYLQTGPFGSQLHAHEYTHDGIPVVMPQDIDDGKIFTHAIARIPELRAKFLARHRVKLGDIIIARRGELSRAAAISQREIGWVCGTGCFLLRLSGSRLDPQFFSYAYRHDIIQRQIEGLAVGSTMPSLNNSVMNSLYFPYLSKDEQHRISERLETQDVALLSLVREKEKLVKQKHGLMHDLLTDNVRVKPVTVPA